VILVSESTVNEVAAAEPKPTAEAPANPVPLIVTTVPPATGPADGLRPVIAGREAYVNASADSPEADVPVGVVTVTLTVPVPAGDTAVICVFESTVNEVAAVPPNATAVAPLNPVPVIFTDVPPATGPTVGLMLVTCGTAS
jgi:hypothetical protein